MSKRHSSIEPVHPGEILREDAFPALGVTKPTLVAALERLKAFEPGLHVVETCGKTLGEGFIL